MEREVKLQLNLSHPNIAMLHGAFEDADNVHLCLEMCSGGDLFHRKDGRKGERCLAKEHYVVNRVISPMLNALQYLHEQV